MNDYVTAFLLLRIRAGRSGHVVELLERKWPEVVEASAVYADTDVVARLWASRSAVANVLYRLAEGTIDGDATTSAPYQLPVVETLIANDFVDGRSFKKEPRPSRIVAYVLADVAETGFNSGLVSRLQKIEGIAYIARFNASRRLLVKLIADNKATFDIQLMDEIQQAGGVSATRTMIAIDGMSFVRDPMPAGETFGAPLPSVDSDGTIHSGAAAWAEDRRNHGR